MSAPHVITINLDARCAECRKPGATPSGICLRCATKAMDPKRTMKSPEGRGVQERWQRNLRRSDDRAEPK